MLVSRCSLEFNEISLNTAASSGGSLEFNGVSLNTAASKRGLARIQWGLAKQRVASERCPAERRDPSIEE